MRDIQAVQVGESADTIPGTPFVDSTPPRPDPLRALYADDAFRALYDFVHGAPPPDWDNLAHIERFARAARFVLAGTPLSAPRGSAPPEEAAPLLARAALPQQRRAVAHLLWLLLPPPQRARAHLPLPDDIARRADDDFALQEGDAPRVAPSLTSFLGRDDLLARLLRPGARVLAPRHACPGAAHGACFVGVIDEVKDGVAKLHVERDGVDVDVRFGVDGKPLLSVDGRAQPIKLPFDELAGWLLAAGPDARGLDLRDADDRALLLVWAHLLRQRALAGRSVFAWLESAGKDTSRALRIAIVDQAIRAAVEAVGTFSLDPLCTRFSLNTADGAWVQEASAWLEDCGCGAALAGVRHEILWADLFLEPGFSGGRLSAVTAGCAFARLATSVLAPLGVLPLSGLKDGSGAVVLQRILPDDDDGNPALAPARLIDFAGGAQDVPLVDAWRSGRGQALPEPKGNPRHDVQQMPAWFSFFLEAIGERSA
jgi:hypothetical protein